ncbi:hypothetical protein C8R43DRAFT_959968 [Mycena crocata]|nr:hypothetical protein C8R43DRAFT_959968 [Mycena crocata]
MSAKNRAIGGTEDEFQAALVTYTKAGNKTMAMRRLWNAAYEMGRAAAPVRLVVNDAATLWQREKERVKEAREIALEEGRQSGFEEGRQAGERDTLTMDVFEVSFAAGKMDGIATGMELGRQAETQRWMDAGHLEDGTCRAFNAVVESPPPQSLPFDNDAHTFSVPGAFSVQTGLSWADDAESLPIHPVLVISPQPRDFSDLRTGSKNPFDSLQRRHARYCGAQTRARPSRRRFHSQAIPATTRHGLSHSVQPRLELETRPKPSSGGHFSILALLAWVWMVVHGRVRGRVDSARHCGILWRLSREHPGATSPACGTNSLDCRGWSDKMYLNKGICVMPGQRHGLLFPSLNKIRLRFAPANMKEDSHSNGQLRRDHNSSFKEDTLAGGVELHTPD